MSEPSAPSTVRIDIVSDVVCPWCIVGFRQLDAALTRTAMTADLTWHPFELNPQMPAEGENLRDHLAAKYGVTPEQSVAARDQLVALGESLGFNFAYGDDKRIVNTFAAHQLLDWALEIGRQHALKLALFQAYFTEGRDVSDPDVLVAIVESVGLDGLAARDLLASGKNAPEVRRKQAFWTENGISGVPAMVFDGKYLLSGAQGIDTYVSVLERCRAKAA